jgi:hypothetical protein
MDVFPFFSLFLSIFREAEMLRDPKLQIEGADAAEFRLQEKPNSISSLLFLQPLKLKADVSQCELLALFLLHFNVLYRYLVRNYAVH